MNRINRTRLDTLYEGEEQLDGNEATESRAFYTTIRSSAMKPAYFKHKENVDVNQAEEEIQNAKEEWELISATVPVLKPSQIVSQPINCDEVLSFFRLKNMSQFLKYIKPVKQRKWIFELIHWLIGPPKLHPHLLPDRDLLFAIAQCPFDTTERVHVRVLQTLYKGLTGTQWDCPRYGRHWEDIGFQGIDPGTDLRGVGFLGLYHLLFFILNPLTSELSKEIVSLSRNEIQDFPFCLMGINITRIVLETLREGVLNKECNRKQDVFLVTNEFYVGIYLHLFQVWKEQKKTILDSGYVLKDLSALAKTNPNRILQGLSNYTDERAKMHLQSKAHCSFSDIGGISLKPTAAML